MREPRKRQQEAAAARNYVAPVERSANIFDMPLDEFQGALVELRSQGLSQDRIDDLMRQYRAQSSPFAGINEAATASQGAIADAGKSTVAGGLLSKPEGATGMDAVRGLQFEGMNGLLGALSGAGQAIDAPMAAARGLIPQGDMALEALGTAGAAMTGGGAVARPAGSLGSNTLRVYHGGTGDVTNAASGRGAWFSEARDLADEYAFNGGSVDQFSITPQRPIKFVHAEQRRPVGDIISTAVESAGDLSEGAIAAARGKISTLRERYGAESRPLFEYWNNDPDIADLFRTLGYDSISVAEKSGGPQTWAALTPDIISANANTSGGLLATAASDTLTPSQQMARRILDMRAAGRARDVTDDMMAQADPQYMFNNTPLPMDEASRMARAGGAGFDDLRFHGTNRDIQSFDPEQTGSRTDSGWYGKGTYLGDENTASIYAQGDNPLGRIPEGAQVYSSMLRGNRSTWDNTNPPKIDAAESAAMTQELRGMGIDGMEVRYGDDPEYFGDLAGQRKETVMYNPQNIRSRFARFDPEFAHLSNLNAANIDPMTGLFGAMAAEEQRRRRNAP